MFHSSGKSRSGSRTGSQAKAPGRPQAARGGRDEQGGAAAGRNGSERDEAGAGEQDDSRTTPRHTEQEASARRKRISGSAAVRAAKEQIYELTNHVCESVSSLSPTRDGWRVVVEVVELERIPQSTDIMASYLVELDDEGELVNYERLQRYYRNEVGGEQ